MAQQQTIPVTIEDEMRSSYLAYAMSVIVGRAIPDVRDGLKPVHRRVMYSMHEQGVRYNTSYKKSARIVGDVLGKYHPHGDQAVYDALVRMAQDFSMRYPLVDGQGNFGSVDGDPPAAMRYTEVRMARVASELLADIDEETVDFEPNFDDSEQEPSVLPSRIPNLLVNGSSGIAVGMATNIPPHNLAEIVDATIRLIENPELSIDELMADDPETGRLGVKGPDFPTAGFIYGTSGIRAAYHTGRGRVVMRARVSIEEIQGRGDREQIVITEIPYQVNKAELLKKIAQLVREKKIEGISDLRDESDRDGMRMVIELKRDAHHEIVLNHLYQQTALQSTFGVNCLAIVNGQPKVLSLKDALTHFIWHRREVVTRRTRFRLRKALERQEIVEGLGMAVTDVDLVVRTIRESKDPDEARERLMALPLKGLEDFVRRAGRPEDELAVARERGDYFLTEVQAKAILEMRLSRLTGLEREKLAIEYGEICQLIAELRAILASDTRLLEVIKEELQEIRERYADPRRTEIIMAEGDIDIIDLIANEAMVVVITRGGYLKRVPLTEYQSQHRGGKGTRAAKLNEEDFVRWLFVANAHDHILFLTDAGKCYLKRVYEIPMGSRASRGRHVNNFIGLEQGEESLASILALESFEDEQGFLLTCSRLGKVKRSELSAYANIRANGLIAVQIEEGDQLLAARLVRETDEVLIGTAGGMSIRFPVSDVRPMGRDTRGVRGIDLKEEDFVIGMDVVEDDEQQVLAVSANGYGKRTPITEWRVQSRGGKGIIAMVTSDRNGPLVKLRLVRPGDQIMAVTNGGQIIRTHVDPIREAGRNTQGVRVIRVAAGERVVDVEPVTEEDEGEDDELPVDSELPDADTAAAIEAAAAAEAAEAEAEAEASGPDDDETE
ncbi:MAG: DNA gyrase subunit A [Sandaracinaceae bacterium]|nr:DNA gyrase subunit A [Sandaracinaceae bacterium]